MNKIDLTIVGVATVLASKFYGPDVAAVVGPYIVILIAAMGGAAVALMQVAGRTRAAAFGYFFIATITSLLFTVSLSMMAASTVDSLREQWLFAPVSFGLGYIGDKWSAALLWVFNKCNSFIDILIELRKGGKS